MADKKKAASSSSKPKKSGGKKKSALDSIPKAPKGYLPPSYYERNKSRDA